MRTVRRVKFLPVEWGFCGPDFRISVDRFFLSLLLCEQCGLLRFLERGGILRFLQFSLVTHDKVRNGPVASVQPGTAGFQKIAIGLVLNAGLQHEPA